MSSKKRAAAAKKNIRFAIQTGAKDDGFTIHLIAGKTLVLSPSEARLLARAIIQFHGWKASDIFGKE